MWAMCAGCPNPDPREVDGALAFAAEAVAERDARTLFKVVDERGRHAMASVVKDRNRAAKIILADYPEAEKASALAALGDAQGCAGPADLFARRCGDACMEELRKVVGAPVSRRTQGKETEVETSRGGRVRLHLGGDTWWGIVWNTQALQRERDRAAAERRQVERNAELYRARRALR